MTVQTKDSWKPTTGGILSIISGAIGLITGLVLVLTKRSLPSGGTPSHHPVVGLFIFVVSIVAIIGGVFALRRKVWGLALAGSICALFNSAGILGILAIIFVAIAKDEFDQVPPTQNTQAPSL